MYEENYENSAEYKESLKKKLEPVMKVVLSHGKIEKI